MGQGLRAAKAISGFNSLWHVCGLLLISSRCGLPVFIVLSHCSGDCNSVVNTFPAPSQDTVCPGIFENELQIDGAHVQKLDCI